MSAPMGELGKSGLNINQGTISEEIAPNLSGRQALKVYRDMADNDPVVGAILFAIKMLMRQVRWRVEENEDGKNPEEQAEFLTGAMDDMAHTWADFIAEAISMLPYGFSFHEVVYKKRKGPAKNIATLGPRALKQPPSKYSDGKVGWHKIEGRSQDSLDRWLEDEDTGDIVAFVQKPPPDYTDRIIPFSKGILFRTDVHKNNPEGRSILRNAYRPWYFKKRIEEIEGVGIERDLAGFPVIWVDPDIMATDASDDEKAMLAAFQQLGANIRRDKQEYLVMPNMRDSSGHRIYEIELLSTGGTRTFDTSAIIARYDQRIAMTVLGDFILLGHETVGSYALSSDKTNLFSVAIGTYLDIIQDTINRTIVPALFAVNGDHDPHLPRIVHGDIENPDLGALAQMIATLANAGMQLLPDIALEQHIRQLAGLPEKAPEAIKAEEFAIDAARRQQEANAEIAEMESAALLAKAKSPEGQAALAGAVGEPAPEEAPVAPAAPADAPAAVPVAPEGAPAIEPTPIPD